MDVEVGRGHSPNGEDMAIQVVKSVGGESTWASIPLRGGESPLGLDPRVASASLQCHNTNIATSRQVGEPCHRFSSGASAAAFTSPLLVHLHLQEADGGNGGVAAR